MLQYRHTNNILTVIHHIVLDWMTSAYRPGGRQNMMSFLNETKIQLGTDSSELELSHRDNTIVILSINVNIIYSRQQKLQV